VTFDILSKNEMQTKIENRNATSKQYFFNVICKRYKSLSQMVFNSEIFKRNEGKQSIAFDVTRV